MLDEPLADEARFSEPLFDVELFAGVLELPDEADFDRDVLVDRGAFAETFSTTAFNAPTAAPVAAPARMSPAASTTFSTTRDGAVCFVPLFRLLLFAVAVVFLLALCLRLVSGISFLPLFVLKNHCHFKIIIFDFLNDTIFSRAYNRKYMDTQVLIAGAGPTGLALAAQLIRYGVDFVIIDKKETTTPYSKAIGVQARTLEIYEQMGIAEDLIESGWIAEKVRLVEGGEVRGELTLKDVGRGMSPYPFLLLVGQGVHETRLYTLLRANGRDVRWQTELESFSQDAEGVSAKVKNAAGEAETINAEFLVGCDGAHSLVRHSLGLSFEGGTFERLFYVADVDIDWKFDHDALHVCLAKNTITAFFPMRGERQWRIVGTFPEGHQGEEGEVLYEEIERQIIADTEMKLDITKVNWFSVYRVHSRHVNKFSEGRSFLAGDSAHIHTPAGAQGMNTGIQDGYNLAWKLAAVLKSNADLKLLDTYNEERLPNAHRLLQTTDRLFQFGASDDWFVSFFRTQIFPYIAGFALNFDTVKNALFPLVSQIGINYRGSSLSVDGEGSNVKAGDRMPYFVVEGSSIYDRLREPKFHLLVFSDGTSPMPEIGNEFDRFADVNTFPLYPNIAAIFGASETFTLVLRPDNYVGYISNGSTADRAKKYLDGILR